MTIQSPSVQLSNEMKKKKIVLEIKLPTFGNFSTLNYRQDEHNIWRKWKLTWLVHPETSQSDY